MLITKFSLFESKQMLDMMELLKKKEDLDPELQPYLNTKSGIPMIQHPLLYSMFHTPEMNAMVNAQFKQKKELVAKALKSKNWSSFIYLYERPYRLEAFEMAQNDLSDKDYWELLREIWIDSENIWQNKAEWKKLITSKRGSKEYFMEADDRKKFKSLPDEITIYRGYQSKNKDGFSYSLNQDKAKWFANRFGTGKVETKVVKKKDCLAYFGGRGEDEIIYIK